MLLRQGRRYLLLSLNFHNLIVWHLGGWSWMMEWFAPWARSKHPQSGISSVMTCNPQLHLTSGMQLLISPQEFSHLPSPPPSWWAPVFHPASPWQPRTQWVPCGVYLKYHKFLPQIQCAHLLYLAPGGYIWLRPPLVCWDLLLVWVVLCELRLSL